MAMQLLWRVEPVPDSQIMNDDFASGLANWSTTGEVVSGTFNTPFPEPPQARIRGAGSTLSRAISLPAGATGITMSFWGRSDQMSANEEVAVQVSFDGGPFTTLRTFTDADNSDTLTFYGGSAERLGFSWYPQTADNVEIRFLSDTNAGAFVVDSVVARALQVPPGTPLPVAGDLPIADAGIDVNVDDNDVDGVELVTLDGSASSDPDGTISTYEWFEITNSGPISLGTGPILTDVSFGHGVHTVQLLTTDNDGGSTGDLVTITVNQTFPNNQAPVANAGPDQTIIDTDGNTLEVVTIDGTGSSDPDGNIVSYAWRKSGTFYSNAALQSATQPIGVHNFELTVTDNQGATNTDTVVVTVVANGSTVIIDNFSANPGVITEGDSTTLSWLTTGATSVSISNGVGRGLSPDGSISVSPTTNTVYTLTATGPGGTHIRSVTVGVNPPPPAPTSIDSFSATPSTITDGNSAVLSWTTSGADSVSINNDVGAGLALDGSISVNPTTTTTYTITAGGPGGPATANVTVTVNPAGPAAPTVDSFNASATTITAGSPVTMSWSTTNADSVSIDNGGGNGMPADGSVIVNPTTTTTYTLTATGIGIPATDTVTVTVQNPPPTGSDFKTQMVKMTIPAGSNSAISAAFTAVDPARTVALISGVTQHAMGWTAETTQDPVEISAHVALSPDGNNLTASRVSSLNQSNTVWVLLIEYTGAGGGANEFVVRDRRVVDWTSGQSASSYVPLQTVADGGKVVVFSGGASNANTGGSHYDRGDVRAWLDGADTVQLVRGDGSGAISSSHQVVEFVGSNWTVQTGDTAPGQDPGGTDVTLSSVGDVSNAWVYFTWSTNSANLDERGHRAWMTSPTNLRVQEDAAATGNKTVRWSVISNPDMQVQSGAANNLLNSANTGSITGFTPVAETARSFAWVTGMTDGGGNAHPRDMWQFELSDAGTIDLLRGRTGQELSYRYFVVELPAGGGTPPPPNVDPVASFTFTTSDLAATFTDGSSDADGNIVAWSWSFGDGGTSTAQNLQHTYASAATYTVSLTVTDDRGGSNTATLSVTVAAAANIDPVASFTFATTDLAATFTDGSSDSDGNIVSRSWIFGDGGASTAQNPTHSYAAAGTYTVSLTVTDDRGGSNVLSQSVTVTAPPPAATVNSFTASSPTITAGQSTNLSWITTNATGVSINNGATLPAVGNTTVSPTTTTTYNLTAIGAGGNATASVTVIVSPPPNVDPVASFTFTISGLAATFTDGSSDGDGSVVTRSWSFGDGGTSTAQNPTHSYAAAGIYTVSLTVTDDRGGSNVLSQSVTVTAPPPAATVNSFTASSPTITAGQSTNLSWITTNATGVSINNGATLPAVGNTTVSPTTTTTYNLTAIGAGGNATASATVTVNQPPNVDPVASFSVSTSDLVATFTDGSSDSDGSLVSWSWNFGDGGTSTAQNPQHTYASAGTYNISLTATDDRGGSNVAAQSVTVTAPPPPPAVQGTVSTSGPTSIDRGERTSYTVILTNTGSSTITGAQLIFTVSPNDLLKDVTPGTTVSVGNVSPGGSVSQTWNVRGDNEGSGSVSAEALSGGNEREHGKPTADGREIGEF